MTDDFRFEVIEVPGSQGTVINDLNAAGDHTGVFLDPDGDVQSYICRNGQCAELSIPEATTLYAHGICTETTVVGDFLTEDDQYRGFKALDDGAAELFDHPQAQNTFVTDCEDGGILGIFDTTDGHRFGFLRSAEGRIEDLAFDDAFDASTSTLLNGMNPRGDIAGCLVRKNSERTISARTTVAIYRDNDDWQRIEVPEDVAHSTATDIGPQGVVIGQWFNNPSTGPNGFIHTDQTFRSFSVPDAMATGPLTINSNGAIAGFFDDKDGTRRGFVARPKTD
jgi:hypothetical protein